MTIKEITETQNETLPTLKPIPEVMDRDIPGIDTEAIPRRNGGIWALCGAGGSGKTNLLLNLFRSRELYREKFTNIFYICPESSFSSVRKHPFEGHDKVYHELTGQLLMQIYEELNELKANNIREKLPTEYNCIIIDDMADALKNPDIILMLNKMLIKARHISTMFIFTLQSFYYFPKICRKQLTYITIFKPKNIEEWNSIAKEVLNMKPDDGRKLYNYVFDEPYKHLDIDTTNNLLYKNFNPLNIIEDEQ